MTNSPSAHPLTYVQEARWRDFQVQGVCHNTPSFIFATRLHGALRISHLSDIIDGLALRHEALRTRVILTDDVPVQIVDPPRAQTLERLDLTATPRHGDARAAAR